MRFSERTGYKKPKTEIQKESIDVELSNGIWNYLNICIFNKFSDDERFEKEGYNKMVYLAVKLWLDFFKKEIDGLPDNKRDILARIKNWYIQSNWYDKYDLIEFIVENHKDKKEVEKLTNNLNNILKRELSAYRIISSKITPITSEIEIMEIEKASNSPIKEVNSHIERAIELFSDRKNPDYRNSIKESISAVETMCKIISKNPKATLNDALNQLANSENIKLHKAL
jgi:hypothetical protein